MLETLIFLAAIAFVVALVALSIYARLPSVKGARGESRIRALMASQLNQAEYHQFHDVTLDSPYGPAQIDHIVVSRYGVFVVETKNFTGWIFGDPQRKQWTQVIYGNKFRFQNPVHQNFKHTKAVESFLGLQSGFVHSVVVFVGDSEFRTPFPPNVTDLRGVIPYIQSKTDELLSSQRVGSIAAMLASWKSDSGRAQQAAELRAFQSEPTCPKCGARMVMRAARTGSNAGTQFWGCSTYPRCGGTKNLVAS